MICLIWYGVSTISYSTICTWMHKPLAIIILSSSNHQKTPLQTPARACRNIHSAQIELRGAVRQIGFGSGWNKTPKRLSISSNDHHFRFIVFHLIECPFLKENHIKKNGGFEQGFEKFFRSRTLSWENQTLLVHAVTPMACLNNIFLPLNNISPWKLPQVCRINMLIKFPWNQKTLFAIYWKLNIEWGPGLVYVLFCAPLDALYDSFGHGKLGKLLA